MQAPSSAFVFAGSEKGRQARRDIDHRETGYEELPSVYEVTWIFGWSF